MNKRKNIFVFDELGQEQRLADIRKTWRANKKIVLEGGQDSLQEWAKYKEKNK